MKKILFIMHMPPPVHGASMVGKYIHESEIINKAIECKYINLSTAEKLDDIGKMGFKKFFKIYHLLNRIKKTVKEFKPDRVYVTPNAKGPAFYKESLIIFMLKRMHQDVIIHFHNKGVSTRQNCWFDNMIYKRYFKKIKVILLSPRLFYDIKKYAKKENVVFCANGIPQIEPKPSHEKRYEGTPHILYLSNLVYDKGVVLLLDACKIMKANGYTFICDYVGGETTDFSTESFNKEIQKRDLADCVIYHGKKYGEDKDQYFKQAQIFTLPTSYDCFPLVCLEAMQYQLPVVSTDEGGVLDMVEDHNTGLICDKTDPESLALSLQKILDNKEFGKLLGENGYYKYLNNFAQTHFEKKLKNILINF